VWLQQAGVVISEALYLPVVTALILVAVVCIDRPSKWRFALLGALLGLAVLVRSEAILLAVLLGGTFVTLAVRQVRERAVAAGTIAAALVVVIAPWVIRNYEVFGAPTLSTNAGGLLAGANCPATYRGPGYGSFAAVCGYRAAAVAVLRPRSPGEPPRNEATVDREMRQRAIDWVMRRPGALPGVLVARDLRAFGLLLPSAQLAFDVREGRHPAVERAGQILHWALLPLALVGALLLPPGSWRRWSVVVAPLAAGVVTIALAYGSTRLRTVAEPSIALFAAAGIVTGWRWVRDRSPSTSEGR
jgi:hypothetical protein